MIKKFRTVNSMALSLAQIFLAEILYFIFGQRLLSNYIRKLSNPGPLLKHLGVTIGSGTNIWPGITINCENRSKYRHLKIGKEVRVLWDVIIDLNDDVIIEDYVHIGTRSILVTHFHLGKSPLGISEYPYVKGKIIVGKGSVVSWGSTILHDSSIGEHSILSAGSTLKGDMPAFTVFGGNPARPIKKIEPKNLQDFE